MIIQKLIECRSNLSIGCLLANHANKILIDKKLVIDKVSNRPIDCVELKTAVQYGDIHHEGCSS